LYEVSPDLLDISKALGEDTRFAIFRQIASSAKPLTVKELVAMFGMHHSAIRIHLNKLEEAGLIVSRKLHNRGVVGRPQLAFVASPSAVGITLPTRNYKLIADLLLEIAKRDVRGEEAAELFAVQWGRSYMRSRGRGSDGPLSFDEAFPILLEELRSLGNYPHDVDMNCAAATITQSNCPFLELAERHKPLVCVLHRGMNRGMLSELTGRDIAWQTPGTMAGGAELCTSRVSVMNGAVV
jgi:predicted ArsR family transcriptional regulator